MKIFYRLQAVGEVEMFYCEAGPRGAPVMLLLHVSARWPHVSQPNPNARGPLPHECRLESIQAATSLDLLSEIGRSGRIPERTFVGRLKQLTNAPAMDTLHHRLSRSPV